MDPLEWFDAAAGRVRDALQHAHSLRGRSGYDAALGGYEQAVEELEKVAREIGDMLHGNRT